MHSNVILPSLVSYSSSALLEAMACTVSVGDNSVGGDSEARYFIFPAKRLSLSLAQSVLAQEASITTTNGVYLIEDSCIINLC